MGLFGPPNVEKLKNKGNINGLIKASQYQNDSKIREQAIKALEEIGGESGKNFIIQALMDQDKSVRMAAANSLESLNWEPGNNETGAYYYVTKQYWDKCIDIGSQSLKPLIIALRDPKTRAKAAEIFGKIGEKEAVMPLLEVFKEEDGRESIVRALGDIGDNRAINPLLSALIKSLIDLQKTIVNSLDKLNWRPDKSEAAANYWIVKNEFRKCVDIGDEAIKPLVNTLNSDDEIQTNAAVNALKDIGNNGVNALIDAALKNSSPQLYEILKEISDVVVEPLMTILHKESYESISLFDNADKENKRLKSTMDLIVQIGAPFVEPLKKELEKRIGEIDISDFLKQAGHSSESTNARFAFMMISAQIKTEQIKHSTVIELLGRIGDKSAVELIINFLTVGADEFAAKYLQKIKFIEGQKLFLMLINEYNQKVRRSAVKALENIGWEPVSDEAAAYFWGVRKEWEKCIELGGNAVKPLLFFLIDKETRDDAAKTLGDIGHLSAVSSLIKLLADESVHSSVVEALVKITGQNFGKDFLKWEEWYKKQKIQS